MQLTIHVPDDMLEKVKDKLPHREVGVLEAIALDAIIGFLLKTRRYAEARTSLISGVALGSALFMERAGRSAVPAQRDIAVVANVETRGLGLPFGL